MSESYDYSALDDQPVFPDFMRLGGAKNSISVEHLWPNGQTKLSLPLGDTHAIAFVDIQYDSRPALEAVATTPTGIFRLRYDGMGMLERVRVRATNMIITSCDHVASDPDAKLHAHAMTEYDDAIISVFPQTHILTVQNYGFTLRQKIVQPNRTMRGASIDLPQFPDIRFAVIYTEAYFSFTTLFGPDQKYAETFITSEIAIPKTLFTRSYEPQLHELGCDILGLK